MRMSARVAGVHASFPILTGISPEPEITWVTKSKFPPLSRFGSQSFGLLLNLLKSNPPLQNRFHSLLTSVGSKTVEIMRVLQERKGRKKTNFLIRFSRRPLFSSGDFSCCFFRFSKSEQALLYSSTMLLQADSMMTWTPEPPRFSLDTSTCHVSRHIKQKEGGNKSTDLRTLEEGEETKSFCFCSSVSFLNSSKNSFCFSLFVGSTCSPCRMFTMMWPFEKPEATAAWRMETCNPTETT